MKNLVWRDSADFNGIITFVDLVSPDGGRVHSYLRRERATDGGWADTWTAFSSTASMRKGLTLDAAKAYCEAHLDDE